MHVWGDKDVDWDGINDAANCIGMGLRTWGRVDVSQFKEKFGTVRVYCILGIRSFHQLIWPGYMFNQFKHDWAWRLDLWLSRWYFWVLPHLFIYPAHRWLYRAYYRWAVQRWPHLREEILCCADWDELLEGL